jgi:hypothetical protein
LNRNPAIREHKATIKDLLLFGKLLAHGSGRLVAGPMS